MPMISKHNNDPVQPVEDIIEDCQRWLSSVILSFFYDGMISQRLPAMFLEWISSPITNAIFSKELIHDIQKSAGRLELAFDRGQKTLPPNREDFEQFMLAYEHFLTDINMAFKQITLSTNGIDDITGYKVGTLAAPEIRRELDRRERKGNPFSVAMLRLDGVTTDEERDFKMRMIATALRQGLRSFDDAYRVADDDLLISLKHADIKGGIRFIERLKAELKNLQAEFTFTSCVAEPDPADDVNEFLINLEADLSQIASQGGGGQTMKFEEVSPLQRFISNLKD